MSAPSFVHLRLHSEFSIVDGIVRIDDAVKRARADGMPALALTDLSNAFALVKFYTGARKQGVKPVIGCDVWITNESNRDQPSRLLLLCKNREGYHNLCELLARAYRENQHRGHAELNKSWFAGPGGRGLIALSGAQLGDVGQALAQQNTERARELAYEWAALFPGHFYLEVQRTGTPQADAHVRQAAALAAELGLPVVATHPIQFLDRDDFKAHEARVCISEGFMLGDPRRPRPFTEEQYFKSQAEMAELFADIPEALENSVEIAKRCNLTIELGKPQLPQFPTPDNLSLDDFMLAEAQSGLAKRLEQLFPDASLREQKRPEYEARLLFETKTIIQMGFPGYFLIVADFINWAKHNGVPVGPGRGSGAGSLVAYSLGITDLDPLRYDLLFERFLNPERVSMPDFDVDFCQDGRERVIEYVRKRYGADSVSQIATFGTMAAKAVVRDVGRVLDLPYNFVDQLAKLIPFELGMTLEKAKTQEPQILERIEKEEEVAELWALGEKLEGMARNVGMHAGGVLIAPGKITDFCPTYNAQGSESVVSQFDKDDVELAGLVKFDFLGLRTLTVIDWAVASIRKQEAGSGEQEPFSIESIPLDDAASFKLLKACNTTAVFQLESRGMKDLIRRLQPDNFEDIIALVALFRPGPLQSGMVDDFINRKHGRARVDYMHPDLTDVLKPTYGVIVYQEQVMQIAQTLGGYTLGSADLLRRAMGKKKAEEMAKHRSIFVEGAVARGVNEKLATDLFNLMEKFAEYGFNKSHSAAYALVAYQTAYLKAHYPAAFMAATLTADMGDTDKVFILYDDCLQNAIELLAPDVNQSEHRFIPLNDKQIRYGLGAIKGTGEAAINSIVQARQQDGPFKDLFDFTRRIDKRVVNRRVIEALICAGAFDSVFDHRASLMASVGHALEAAEQAASNANQASLFGALDESAAQDNQLVEVARWPEKELLMFEKKSLGFYFSGHPYDAYAPDIAGFVKTKLGKLAPQHDKQLIAGIIYSMRTQMTRRGKMAFVALDDGEAQIEVAIFNEVYERYRAILQEDQLLVVEGKISKDDYSGGLRVSADALYDLSAARTKFAKGMRLMMNGQANAVKLKEMLAPYRQESDNGCLVTVSYINQDARCEMTLGEGWRVQLHENLLGSLRGWLSTENVAIQY
ncbi:MAG: DNA polymerase III subunit alpha [Hydrogenophilales bacterium]|nr:DNA polymerase III subunit alpha [Hydrogenophilales bacterium]